MMRLIAVAALLLTLVPATAHAEDATETARQHYNKGTTLFDLGRYKEAAAEYELAYQAKNDAAILFNIAQVYRLAGEPARAITFYRSYLRRTPNATNRAEVELKIAELQRAIDQQEHAKLGPPDGTLRPDASSAKAQPIAEPAAPPPTAAPAAPTAPAASATSPDSSLTQAPNAHGGRTKKLAGIGVAAGGVAILALGGAFVGLASQANGQVITSDNRFSAAAEDRRNNYQVADAVCFAVGGAAVVTGVVLLVLGVRESRAHVAAGLAPGRGVAMLSWGF
jgi:tetratricopeptide (TPR) repeat protein